MVAHLQICTCASSFGYRCPVSTTRYTINDMLHEARASVANLQPHAAFDAVRAGALIIDTRTAVERKLEGVIAGSLHMPRTLLEWGCDPASGHANPAINRFDQHLIIMCNEGYSSALAAVSLQRLGFVHAANLDGGYRAWRAAGLPTQAPARALEDETTNQHPPEPGGAGLVAIPRAPITLRYWLYRLFLRSFA